MSVMLSVQRRLLLGLTLPPPWARTCLPTCGKIFYPPTMVTQVQRWSCDKRCKGRPRLLMPSKRKKVDPGALAAQDLWYAHSVGSLSLVDFRVK